MTEKRCKNCKKIIIGDWDSWRAENAKEPYVQCPYCMAMEDVTPE